MKKRAGVAAMLVVLGLATPAWAQRAWVEATGPNLTVVTDASAGRARDLVWQFEQVREAMSRIFPWVRLRASKPLVVLGARNEATMRQLAPEYFEPPYQRGVVSVGSEGMDRAYIALRADARTEDREGVNPYEHAYWSFAARALSDTSSDLPAWLRRGMASVVANTLVRDKEIQLGRVIDRHLAYLRSRPRMPLSEVVSLIDSDDSRMGQEGFLEAHDAHSWALVHFLIWANQGAYQAGLNGYFTGLLRGADPVKTLVPALGDVTRLETAFNVYVSRDIFPFTKFLSEAKLRREAFPVRDVPPVELALLQASMHVAMRRPAEAKGRLAEARALQPTSGAEVEALIAEREGRRDDMRRALAGAAEDPLSSWFAPYRLATLESPMGQSGYRRVRQLLEQATAKNGDADEAWAYLAVALAELDEREAAVAAVTRAIDLAPASSENRRLAARAYLRLRMMAEARESAGLARAFARDPQERGMAQDMLAAVARASAEPEEAPSNEAASSVAAAGNETSPSAAPAVSGPDLPTPAGPVSEVAVPTPASAAGGTGGRSVGLALNDCYLDPGACKAALPVVEQDCRNASSPSSGAACRGAGYILDAGLGMTAEPARAADLYRLGCDRRDDLSCVRLATLRSLGRGVPRDRQAALAVLEPACGRGLQEACYRLGLHLTSTGNAADLTRARDVLSASCAADFAESCAALKKLPR